jgi:hypothetical protein
LDFIHCFPPLSEGFISNLRYAWCLWTYGPIDPTEHDLLGVRLFWWNRIGTILQIFALILLIIEIAGSERLDRLRDALFERRKNRIDKNSWLKWEREYNFDEYEDAKDDEIVRASLISLPFTLLLYSALLIGGLVISAFPFIFAYEQGWPNLLEWEGLLFIIFIVVTVPLGLIMFLWAASGIARFVLFLLSYALIPLASLVSSSNAKALLNVFILISTLFNIHFTLLTQ